MAKTTQKLSKENLKILYRLAKYEYMGLSQEDVDDIEHVLKTHTTAEQIKKEMAQNKEQILEYMEALKEEAAFAATLIPNEDNNKNLEFTKNLDKGVAKLAKLIDLLQ